MVVFLQDLHSSMAFAHRTGRALAVSPVHIHSLVDRTVVFWQLAGGLIAIDCVACLVKTIAAVDTPVA